MRAALPPDNGNSLNCDDDNGLNRPRVTNMERLGIDRASGLLFHPGVAWHTIVDATCNWQKLSACSVLRRKPRENHDTLLSPEGIPTPCRILGSARIASSFHSRAKPRVNKCDPNTPSAPRAITRSCHLSYSPYGYCKLHRCWS